MPQKLSVGPGIQQSGFHLQFVVCWVLPHPTAWQFGAVQGRLRLAFISLRRFSLGGYKYCTAYLCRHIPHVSLHNDP